MKKKSLLLAAVSAVLMSACSQDMNTDVTEKTAAVDITVSGANAAATRATGTALPTESEDNVITNVTVGLFKTDGTTDAISEGTLKSGHITVTGTEGERQVVVVANAPTKTFAGALTKTEFLKRTTALTQTKTMLPMSGQGSSTVTLVAGATTAPKLDVVISRLVARIQMVSLKTAFSATGQYANATFTADRVFLYNAKSVSSVDVTPLTSALIHGYTGTAVGEATLLDQITGQSITADAYKNPYYFYSFANDATKETATKLVIGGVFKADGKGDGVYVYYPAVINRAQQGTVFEGNTGSHTGIMRNNIYSVEATIKSIGVNSPADFMEPADFDLGITVAPWSLTVTQKIDF